MGKKIQWRGNSIRFIHGFVFRPGQVIEVENEELALDILTQPGEPFVMVDELPPVVPESKPESGTKLPVKKSRKTGNLAEEE